MKVGVEIDGRARTVEIAAGPAAALVTLDGRPLSVSVSPGPRFWSLIVDSRSYEVGFAEQGRGRLLVYVNGRTIAVATAAGANFSSAVRRARGSSAAADGPQPVIAPMPGRVIRLLVRVGERVEPRQALVMIEAMKMENELRSPKAGTIREIRVEEGASVEAGAVVAIVE